MPDAARRPKAKPRRPAVQGGGPAREIRRDSGNDAPPLFGLSHLARGFTIADCERDEKAALADLLGEMSRRTWHDLILGSRRGTGFEKIARASINVGIPAIVTDDVQLLAIRISQRSRLIGFRAGAVFQAVWVDPRHRVYDG